MQLRGHGMMYCNANNANMQCHFVGVRGCGMMYCNINGGNTQCRFVEFRGHGHDKSVPYAYGVDVAKRGAQ